MPAFSQRKTNLNPNRMTAVMTHSGRLVGPARAAAPTLADIALSLSRMPRFAGHTRIWWTVLDHSMFVAHMHFEDALANDTVGRGGFWASRLALLLHDAHEAITADVPSGMKPDSLRAKQRELDRIIVAAHFGPWEEFEEREYLIKGYDIRALVAEAHVLGPERLTQLGREVMQAIGFPIAPYPHDIELLERLIRDGTLSHPMDVYRGENASNVHSFLRMVDAAQKAAGLGGAAVEEPRFR
jgi:hypothetical protein